MGLDSSQSNAIASAIIYSIFECVEMPLEISRVKISVQQLPDGFTAEKALDLICFDYYNSI